MDKYKVTVMNKPDAKTVFLVMAQINADKSGARVVELPDATPIEKGGVA